MSYLAPQTWAGARPKDRRQFAREMTIRCVVAAVAVVLCYCFRWELLREITATANVRLDALFGVHLQRLSFDTVAWQGETYRYVVACTFADVWCGSLAFLWRRRDGWLRNLEVVALWTVALFAFNIFRLSLSDVLFAKGVSWNLAHNVVGGLAYFAVWEVLWARLRQGKKAKMKAGFRVPVENV